MEPKEGSETSAFKSQTPGKYPKEDILHEFSIVGCAGFKENLIVSYSDASGM